MTTKKKILIGLAVLFLIGTISNALKSPEEKAAEVATRDANRVKREAERAQKAIDKQQRKAEEDAAASARQQQELDALPKYTAHTIAAAYDANTVAADNEFKGKKFKVSGLVDSINTGLTGKAYITMRGGVNQFMEPQLSFSRAETQSVAGLRKGMKVTLVCEGRGDIAKTPMMGDCHIL